MIFRLLLVVALVYFSLLAIIRFLKRPGKNGGKPDASEMRSRKITLGLVMFALLTLFLAAIGRLHWLGALIATVLPLLKNLADFSAYLFRKESDKESREAPAKEQNISVNNRQQAMNILGLKEPFSDTDVIDAHRRLIQKLHPDRGGNDFLSSQINAARDFLLRNKN